MIADSLAATADRTIVVGATSTRSMRGLASTTTAPARRRILEIAEEVAKLGNRATGCGSLSGAPRKPGLIGSTAYVAEQVANGGIEQIEANLNFDMVGSPNFARFVYDGDSSDTSRRRRRPGGLGEIEQLFDGYFARRVSLTDPTAFDGRSDYGPFIAERRRGRRPVHRRRRDQHRGGGGIYGGFAGPAVRPVLPPGV